MDNNSLNAFVSDLSAQLDLYHSMVELNDRQVALLEAPENADPNDLMALVGHKQTLMGELGRLEQHLAPFKEAWKDSREGLEPDTRAYIDELLEALAGVIRHLIEQEDIAHRRLEEVMAATSESIGDIRRKSQVNRAYSAYGQPKPAPRFVDRRMEG